MPDAVVPSPQRLLALSEALVGQVAVQRDHILEGNLDGALAYSDTVLALAAEIRREADGLSASEFEEARTQAFALVTAAMHVHEANVRVLEEASGKVRQMLIDSQDRRAGIAQYGVTQKRRRPTE